jgi:S1-C subfamily serine protease
VAAIDNLIRLDLALSPAAEGGALIDVQGRVVGMARISDRGAARWPFLATINLAVDQLLARGHVQLKYGVDAEENRSRARRSAIGAGDL